MFFKLIKLIEVVRGIFTRNAALHNRGVWGINQVENSHQLIR